MEAASESVQDQPRPICPNVEHTSHTLPETTSSDWVSRLLGLRALLEYEARTAPRRGHWHPRIARRRYTPNHDGGVEARGRQSSEQEGEDTRTCPLKGSGDSLWLCSHPP
jgi:hypothetical protein